MSGVKNYGIIRGEKPRQFLIGDEILTVRKLPARIHLEFTAWRAQMALPKAPAVIPEDDQTEYRSDNRTEDEMLMDLAIMTLNAARNKEQEGRFEVTEDWLLENVSGDCLDELIQDVMDPFLTHLEEKDIKARERANRIMAKALDQMLRELVRDEINTRMKTSNSSAKSSGKPPSKQDGQQTTVSTS